MLKHDFFLQSCRCKHYQSRGSYSLEIMALKCKSSPTKVESNMVGGAKNVKAYGSEIRVSTRDVFGWEDEEKRQEI